MSYIVDGVTYYTVRFLNYAGTDLLGTVDVPEGGDATPYAPEPEVFEKMVFIGWNRDITNIVNDKTVRPVYHNLYTVVFMNHDGTAPLSTQLVEETKDAVPPEPEQLPGRTFLRWDKNYTNVKSDLTISPVYDVSGFTVKFMNYEDTAPLSIQYVDRGGDAIPPTPEKFDDRIFIGWDGSYTRVYSDRVIKPIYRKKSTVLEFYATTENNFSGELIKTYRAVNSCNIIQKLSGECTIDVQLLTRDTDGYVDVRSRLEIDGLVFSIVGMKKAISGGICYTQFSGEHISYILNDDEYKIQAFEQSGSVKSILETLLMGTPFTVGTVDIEDSVTLRINSECTRRAAIMQLIAISSGEIEYYGYTIGIRKHIGNSDTVDIIKKAAVQNISFTYNASDNTTNYEISLYKKGSLSLGDELVLSFKPMAIHTKSRIVGIDWNPFNHKEVTVTVGAYIPTMNDALYDHSNSAEDITSPNAKYTIEFGEMIGNGSFYFTRPYTDRPYFHLTTDDGSIGTISFTRKGGDFGEFIGATLSGVASTTTTLLVFYCTLPA
jgi:hypothetical protein